MTDPNTQPTRPPEPAAGTTEGLPPTPDSTIWTPPTEAAASVDSTSIEAPSAPEPAVEPSQKNRRRWVEAAVVAGAFVLIGGIGFAAGRTIDDSNGRGSGIHRMNDGSWDGTLPNRGQLPDRGTMPWNGRNDGTGGFRDRDASEGSRRQGRGRGPGGTWQMPGSGWRVPGGPLYPGATPAPDATQPPSPTPSSSPSTTP